MFGFTNLYFYEFLTLLIKVLVLICKVNTFIFLNSFKCLSSISGLEDLVK